jgi:hypothetical protein
MVFNSRSKQRSNSSAASGTITTPQTVRIFISEFHPGARVSPKQILTSVADDWIVAMFCVQVTVRARNEQGVFFGLIGHV